VRKALKQAYFDSQSIDRMAELMIVEVQNMVPRRNYSINLNQAGLLVLDMQKYFLSANSHAFVPSALAIVPRINQLIAHFNQCQRPVILTRHSNCPENALMMKSWWRHLLAENMECADIIADLSAETAVIINKSQYDAFYQTDLETILHNCQCRQLIICGVMAHLCCETTARAAFVRGFEVFFTVDATADYSLNFHKASLLNLAHGFAHPVLVKTIINHETA
jgi:isochorismate hydrolase